MLYGVLWFEMSDISVVIFSVVVVSLCVQRLCVWATLTFAECLGRLVSNRDISEASKNILLCTYCYAIMDFATSGSCCWTGVLILLYTYNNTYFVSMLYVMPT